VIGGFQPGRVGGVARRSSPRLQLRFEAPRGWTGVLSEDGCFRCRVAEGTAGCWWSPPSPPGHWWLRRSEFCALPLGVMPVVGQLSSPLQGHGWCGHQSTAHVGTTSVPVRCWWVIKPASAMAADTPPERAAPATRRSTGRHSTSTTRPSTGQRSSASLTPPISPRMAGPNHHFSSKTRSSIGRVIFTLLPDDFHDGVQSGCRVAGGQNEELVGADPDLSTKKFLARWDLQFETVWCAIEPAWCPG